MVYKTSDWRQSAAVEDVGNGAKALVVVTPGATAENPKGTPESAWFSQKTVSASANALPNRALINGLVVKAKSTNAGPVFVGLADVTAVDTGSGSGFKLLPGESLSISVVNASIIHVAGTPGDVVYVAGS